MDRNAPAAGLGGLRDRGLPVCSPPEYPLEPGAEGASGVSAGSDVLLCAGRGTGARQNRKVDAAAPLRLALSAAAIAPYCAVSFAFGTFHWRAFCSIAALAARGIFLVRLAAARTLGSDVLFLIFIAVVWLSKILAGAITRGRS